MMGRGWKIVLVTAATTATLMYLTFTGRLRNAESSAEHETIHHTGKLPGGGWWDGFLSSWSMILVSEIGDKTFFIACLMAMRHPRVTVFAGAISALVVQTVLSAVMGSIVPKLLPPFYTQVAAVLLFCGFGCKLLLEARGMSDDEDEPDELQEAADEIRKKDEEYGNSPLGFDVESGVAGHTVARRDVASPKPPAEMPDVRTAQDSGNLSPKKALPRRGWLWCFSPIWVQAFTLTFLAEWGDRSQIATIALAAAKNPWGVCIGGAVGHSICTGGAVILGQKIAHALSPRHVTIIGGGLFIFFGFLTAYGLWYGELHHGLAPADNHEVQAVVQGLSKHEGQHADLAARATALIHRLSDLVGRHHGPAH